LPSDRVLFLSLDEVLEIHERVIDAYGGAGGVRDLGLLESALYRPQSGYYEDLVTMAAALFESLLMNHPFVDGNKVDADEAHVRLIDLLRTGQCDLEHLSEWIRASVTR